MIGDRYLLHEPLGTGGAAVVHRATDTRLDREVAVKLLRDTVVDEHQRARFVSEARLLGGLSHPHLVRVLDAGVDEDRPYLVLELVEGRTLAEAMPGLAPEQVARTGAQVARALAHAHAAGIVHRDVKPANVLVAADGSAKLSDFGIARLVDDTVHHTRTGMVVGTVAYLAPEQVAGEHVTTAADVYSWGLVLLEALTGVRSYGGTSVEAALARLTRPPDVPTSLPSGWRELLVVMTAREPGDRPTAAEAASRLGLLSGDLPSPTVAVRRAPAAAAYPVPSHRTALAGLVAGLLLLGGVSAWSAWTGDREASSATPSVEAVGAAPPASADPPTTPTAGVEVAAAPSPEPHRGARPAKHGHHGGGHQARHHTKQPTKHHGKGHGPGTGEGKGKARGHGPKKHHHH